MWTNRYHEDFDDRNPGPFPGEFQGLPINDANRARGETWSPSLLSVPERQCIPHPADYSPMFSNFQITHVQDPASKNVIAYRYETAWMNEVRMIWIDGRPHPADNTMHTWQGFSTGQWNGDVLTVDTTHLKLAHVRRNGIVRSGRATAREHFIRNNDLLTIVTIVTDPVYLTEPFIRSRDFVLNLGYQITSFPCTVGVEVVQPRGWVPHNLPGENDSLDDFAVKYRLPLEATMGGAATMYPEFMLQMKSLPVPPAAAR